jgi:hypothetical protein
MELSSTVNHGLFMLVNSSPLAWDHNPVLLGVYEKENQQRMMMHLGEFRDATPQQVLLHCVTVVTSGQLDGDQVFADVVKHGVAVGLMLTEWILPDQAAWDRYNALPEKTRQFVGIADQPDALERRTMLVVDDNGPAMLSLIKERQPFIHPDITAAYEGLASMLGTVYYGAKQTQNENH